MPVSAISAIISINVLVDGTNLQKRAPLRFGTGSQIHAYAANPSHAFRINVPRPQEPSEHEILVIPLDNTFWNVWFAVTASGYI